MLMHLQYKYIDTNIIITYLSIRFPCLWLFCSILLFCNSSLKHDQLMSMHDFSWTRYFCLFFLFFFFFLKTKNFFIAVFTIKLHLTNHYNLKRTAISEWKVANWFRTIIIQYTLWGKLHILIEHTVYCMLNNDVSKHCIAKSYCTCVTLSIMNNDYDLWICRNTLHVIDL